MRVILKAIFHFLVIIVYRPKVTGRENIPTEGRMPYLSKPCTCIRLCSYINYTKKASIFYGKRSFI